jgi:spermidine synthase
MDMKPDLINGISREEVAVVVSGVVSMGLEILAGRVIAPEYGSTIYTWGSIIGVSMLALSIGYHYGGKNASKIKEMADLEKFLIYTSGYILAIMYFEEVILSAASAIPINATYSPIIPITMLFGPPTYFLGYISPYAAEISSKETKGEASGHFYAIGTAGSILGAFGTTFVLIPSLSTDIIYLIFAVSASIPLISGIREKRSYWPLIVILTGLILIQGPVSGKNTVYADDTAYQHLEITRSDGVTTMYLEGMPQSAKYTNSTETPWSYPEYFYLPFLMRKEIDNALFIGGGGFVGPQQFAEKGVKVDAVELDPGVVEAAQKYFNLSESENLSVHTMDGREYLQQTNKTYDVIVVDAYRKDKVPFHMTTKEFFGLVYERTDSEGVVLSNVISSPSGPGSKFARSYYKTMNKEFPSMYYFRTKDSSSVQNIQIIGSKSNKLSKKRLIKRNRDFKLRNLSSQIENLDEVKTSDAQVLTDDYAPVDKLLNPLIGRKYVVS